MRPHLNFFNVMRLVCTTDLTQIPIAAFSFVDPRLAFTVLRTDLIHLHNALARDPPLERVIGFGNPGGGIFVIFGGEGEAGGGFGGRGGAAGG